MVPTDRDGHDTSSETFPAPVEKWEHAAASAGSGSNISKREFSSKQAINKAP